jgi:hypothetical protein
MDEIEKGALKMVGSKDVLDTHFVYGHLSFSQQNIHIL